MRLLSIEPTPSPNTMKLNVDVKLATGQRFTYRANEDHQAHDPLNKLLAISGVRGLFYTADFIALDRHPAADWEPILAQARQLLQPNAGQTTNDEQAVLQRSSFGEAQTYVQLFRGIPIQIRVRMNEQESRAAMPERFTTAVTQAASATMIRERKLEELGTRYGEMADIITELLQELEASYPQHRLDQLVSEAVTQSNGAEQLATSPATFSRPTPPTKEQLAISLASTDWKQRYEALARTLPSNELIPLFVQALRDEQSSIRRLAVVYLGELRTSATMPWLIEALQDRSVSVRRTAGDALSDWGDPVAIPAMIAALQDSNKLVRWRAARFLYEVGDHTALFALHQAADDEEFEIRLQIEMAITRIEKGEEAAGSVWQQMTARRSE